MPHKYNGRRGCSMVCCMNIVEQYNDNLVDNIRKEKVAVRKTGSTAILILITRTLKVNGNLGDLSYVPG